MDKQIFILFLKRLVRRLHKVEMLEANVDALQALRKIMQELKQVIDYHENLGG